MAPEEINYLKLEVNLKQSNLLIYKAWGKVKGRGRQGRTHGLFILQTDMHTECAGLQVVLGREE